MKSKTKETGLFPVVSAVVAACLVFAVMQGIRDNYGIMLNPLVERTGVGYANISLIIAVGQFLYGVTQPLFGMLALRKSNAFVMLCGIVLMAAGLIGSPLCSSFFPLLLFFGILLPTGTGALCFGIIMGAITPIIGERRAAAVSGIVQASAGIGDALMSPALQGLISLRGIGFSMTAFSMPILVTFPVVLWLGRCRRSVDDAQTSEQTEIRSRSLGSILKEAVRERDFLCLLIGFSTCGFHMSIVENHLFSQYLTFGIPAGMASFIMTVYGITTMLGAMLTGFLGLRFHMKNVLASVYGIRVLIALGFLFLPKGLGFAIVATSLLGITGDSTVPPTSGIVSQKFGASRMAIVYGTIFIGHQVGAFTSAWLGGVFVDTAIGYSGLWVMDLILSGLAAAASFAIRERSRAMEP